MTIITKRNQKAIFMISHIFILYFICIRSAALNGQTAISTCQELQDMKNDLSGDYYLTKDIDCTFTSLWNLGLGFEPVGSGSNAFTGTFNGQGYKIQNLYINRTEDDYIGLFGFILGDGKISNVGLENVVIMGHSQVGALAGKSRRGRVINCYATGSITGYSSVGGLIGDFKGDVRYSYAKVNITIERGSGGGLIGNASYVLIDKCYATGEVTRGGVGANHGYGGLIGWICDGTISNSYATGNVSGIYSVGGLIGFADGRVMIYNCYARGSVDSDYTSNSAGGLVGINGCGNVVEDPEVYHSFSTGRVLGTGAGGFIGYNGVYATVTNCYWDIYRSELTVGIGDGSSGDCTGKNSGNSESNYWFYSTNAPMNEWDFESTWHIISGSAYPSLIPYKGDEVPQDAIIRIDPASKSISKSQTGTVNVEIENVTELSGFEFTIDYDPAVVQVSDESDFILGNFLGSTGRSVIPLTPTIDNTTGQMTYTVGSFGSQTCPSGQGILATITWMAASVGTSTLDLSSAQITDPMGDPMTVTLIDGQIVVTDTHFADVDGDGDVDIVDIQKVAAHYGSQEGDPDWDSKYDIDKDGDVDIVDIQKVAAWYGEDISG